MPNRRAHAVNERALTTMYNRHQRTISNLDRILGEADDAENVYFQVMLRLDDALICAKTAAVRYYEAIDDQEAANRFRFSVDSIRKRFIH